MAEVPFEGRIDRRLAVEAQRLYLRPGPRGAVMLVVGLVIIFSCMVAVPWILHGSGPGAVSIAEVAAFMALWVASMWFFSPILNARRVERTSRIFGTPLHGRVTEAGVHLESAYGTSDLPWELFFRFKATESLVILYQSAQMFNVFPRSFFGSDEDWRRFRAWVEEKVPAVPRRRPGNGK